MIKWITSNLFFFFFCLKERNVSNLPNCKTIPSVEFSFRLLPFTSSVSSNVYIPPQGSTAANQVRITASSVSASVCTIDGRGNVCVCAREPPRMSPSHTSATRPRVSTPTFIEPPYATMQSIITRSWINVQPRTKAFVDAPNIHELNYTRFKFNSHPNS